ncbi:hypothetical protein KNU79_gp78 [Gordonia phage NadineRae]|uniref:Uncharacterized protein n=1 Tax=Gordonia phage NadineRae TaxID=2652882 RepID=A0A5P8DHN8_9CAUD|nr:hypothetical protein KNU79_gp78 [Gordonia phage NadineRae]QFP97760.1 hypothetical protein SEA_NADINERAE_78 [Gordonia phage NadineRae]
MTTFSIRELTDDDAAQYLDNRPRMRAFHVDGRGVSGPFTVQTMLTPYGAPVHRPIDPSTGREVREDRPVASYPGFVFEFGPAVVGTYVNTHDDAQRHPYPFTVNGREYRRLIVRADFHPIDVVESSDFYGVKRAHSANGYTLAQARTHCEYTGEVVASPVPGTDGEAHTGIYVVDVCDSLREVTDAARRTLRRLVSHVIATTYLGDESHHDDMLDLIARDIRADVLVAEEISIRWQRESARLQNLAVAARTSALRNPIASVIA